MDSAVVRSLLDFFQDYLSLCQQEDWPNSETTEAEIKNAFIIAQHIQKCITKLQENHLFEELLQAVNNKHSDVILKYCLEDPPKYVLKKIITSDSDISNLDMALREFSNMFKDKQLEDCLTEFMVEAASAQTLCKNINKLPKEAVVEIKSQLFLTALTSCNDQNVILDLLQKEKDSIELLVVSLLNKEMNYHNAVEKIKDALNQAMACRNSSYQKFWRNLLNLEQKLFTDLCLEHNCIAMHISKALVDSSKLLRQSMSAECFYININYAELVASVQKLCSNDNLKVEFLIQFSDKELEYWEDLLR